MALREQRVGGGMDSDLLATFGDLPNGNSSSSKEVGHSPLKTTASMRGSQMRSMSTGLIPIMMVSCGKHMGWGVTYTDRISKPV